MAQRTRQYSPKFKARMIQRMSPPDSETGAFIALETGVAPSTLSRWMNNVGSVTDMTKTTTEKQLKTSAPTSMQRRPEDWSAEERLLIVAKSMELSDDELGELLRRAGLHEAQLQEWKCTFVDAMKKPVNRATNSKERKKVKKLERELRRKDKALAETAALLVLQKKVQDLWGDEGGDT